MGGGGVVEGGGAGGLAASQPPARFYLETALEDLQGLPAGLARILQTLREVDGRLHGLAPEVKQKAEELVQRNPACGRNTSDAARQEVRRMLAELQEGQEDLRQLAEEKVQLARSACDLVDARLFALDTEELRFEDELASAGEIDYSDRVKRPPPPTLAAVQASLAPPAKAHKALHHKGGGEGGGGGMGGGGGGGVGGGGGGGGGVEGCRTGTLLACFCLWNLTPRPGGSRIIGITYITYTERYAA